MIKKMKLFKLNTNELSTTIVSYSNLEEFIGTYEHNENKLIYADNLNLSKNSIVLLIKQIQIKILNQDIKFYKILTDNGIYWIKSIELFEEL